MEDFLGNYGGRIVLKNGLFEAYPCHHSLATRYSSVFSDFLV